MEKTENMWSKDRYLLQRWRNGSWRTSTQHRTLEHGLAALEAVKGNANGTDYRLVHHTSNFTLVK